MKRRPWTRCSHGYGTESHCPRRATRFVRDGQLFRFLCGEHGRDRGAAPIRSDVEALRLVEQLDQRRRERPKQSRRRSPLRLTYRSLEEDPSYEHTVDKTVRLRVGRRDLQRIVVTKGDAIVKALGRRRRLWFDFESAADELRSRREAAYYDVGVEHGITAARVHVFGRADGTVRALTERMVREVWASNVSSTDATRAALLAGWALLGRRRVAPKTREASRSGRRASTST